MLQPNDEKRGEVLKSRCRLASIRGKYEILGAIKWKHHFTICTFNMHLLHASALMSSLSVYLPDTVLS